MKKILWEAFGLLDFRILIIVNRVLVVGMLVSYH